MQFKPINREWVKNAAIVFLAVLLVLTFFSNTIMNRTLPEVATQYVTSGTVTARVRGTGTVVANGSHQVKAESTREIRSVMVRVGQEVNAGDVLFILGEGDADDLDAAQEQLRQLQISYQRAAINSPTFNYTAAQRRIDAAKKAYDEAQAAANAAKAEIPQGDQDEIDQAKAKWKQAEEQLEQQRASFEERRQKALERVTEAQKKVDELRAAAEANPSSAPESNGAGENTQPPASPPQNTAESVPSPEVTTDPPKETNSPPPEETGDPASSTPEPVASALTASSDGNYRISLLTVGDPSPSPDVEKEPTELEKAEQELADAKLALELMDETTDPSIKIATDIRDDAKAEWERLTQNPSSPEVAAYRAAQAAADEALAAYQQLQDELDAQKESDNKSQALAGLDMADIAAQIERQKKIIEELAGGDGNQVLANVSGTVESIECTAGDTVMEDGVLCTIEVPDMGYTLSFSVTNDQARRLSPGDTASVTNYYWGSQINATLSTIRVDPEKPQTNKMLTFDLDGDVSAGSEITLSVGQRSAGYDTIVPNSAIRSDSNGSFVLIVESKSSPLGNRYIARRVDVEVLAADDINSAVTGDLSAYSYVITTSNAPVNNGDMVRMADT